MKKLRNVITVAIVLISMVQCKKTETVNSDQGKQVEVTHEISEKEAHQHDDKDDKKYVSKEVKVIGDIVKPLTITVDSLKKMNVKELKDMKIVCQSGLTKDSVKTTKGVLLTDILNKAKIDQKDHKDRNFYIVARATDDYKATFSWAELFNNPAGENVYVLFEQNGKPLTDKGEMIVVSLSDIKTGPRHVRWLKSIEVTRVK